MYKNVMKSILIICELQLEVLSAHNSNFLKELNLDLSTKIPRLKIPKFKSYDRM
jgi:hypothetical protein